MSEQSEPTGRARAPGSKSELDAFGPRSWTRPEVVAFGRRPSGRLLVPFPDEESATRARDEWESPWHLDLGGVWRFRLRPRPEDVDLDDLCGDVAGGGWHDLEVPGTWTMQGFDRPHYTNVQMPFPGPPPHVPDENPTGVHRRTITVPTEWSSRRVVLHVGGAESVLYVFVDGAPIAMGKDSRLPHEIDLTDVLVPGRPAELCLVVVRWSDATYLEDQDHWHHAGLHRDVFLYSTSPLHVADLHTRADLDPSTGAGTLTVEVTTEAPADAERTGWSARLTLLDPDDAPVLDALRTAEIRFEHPDNWVVNAYVFGGRGATFSVALDEVRPWSAEAPLLYRVLVTLVDPDGRDVETVTLRSGFRRIEVRGHELLINGRPVLLKGVNRHDHDPRRGKAVTRSSMRSDVVAMKRHNLNALRTSHYPAHHHLYDLCDELGLYVVGEANLETHAYLRSLTSQPEWAPAILERITRMARRDKDHPSVIIWSLGNESGTSPALDAAAAWLRAYDPGRPVQYEGGLTAEQTRRVADEGRVARLPDVWRAARADSDLVVPMYPPIADLVAWATESPPDRPLVMCEYQHAMGNSCGSLADYWDAIRAHPGLQGGFVWDWIDQSLVQPQPDGTERWTYGGDFGDEPTDGTFCNNGLIGPDRAPHPSLLELAKVVQPVRTVALDARRGLLQVTAETEFGDLSHLVPVWVVTVDGEIVERGTLDPLRLAPGESQLVRVPFAPPTPGPGESAHLTLRFELADDTAWADAGHVVAWDQFELERVPVPAASYAVAFGELGADATTGVLRGGGIVAGPEPRLWRAPTDNDLQASPPPATRWDEWGLAGLRPDDRTVSAVHDGAVRISERLIGAREAVAFDHEVVVHALDGGGVEVHHELVVPAAFDDLPRVGARLTLAPGIETVDWVGLGPHEAYSDRRASVRFGRWETSPAEWGVRYVHPQGNGNRMGVRRLRLRRADGTGLAIDAPDDLQVTVAPHTDEDLAWAAHLDEVPVRAETFVSIDVAQRGVGTGACGPDTLAPYRIGPGTYRWRYRLREL